MINNNMEHNDKIPLTEVTIPTNQVPDEMLGFNIEAKFIISDPDTGNVIVEGKG